MTVVSRTSSLAGGRRSLATGSDRASALDQIDWILVGAVVALVGFGFVMVTVASDSHGTQLSTSAQHQFLFDVLGLTVGAGLLFIDYQRLLRSGVDIYGASVVLLVVVLSPAGSRVNGARSWFSFAGFQLQPAEIVKLGLIITLAVVAGRTDRGDRDQLDGGHLTVCIALLALSTAFIVLQPDLGEALVLSAITIAVVTVAGASSRHLTLLALLGVVGAFAVLQTGMIKHYQLDRLTYFINPETSGTGTAAYNAHQAQVAIGSGGLFGQGLFHGTQTKLHFVPEQQTDFIFSVIGEELGFAGVLTMLALDAVIVWRIWRAAVLSRDREGTLICTGVLGMFLFHLFENAGMNMGIMPITGIPLPLVSYGGSATIVTLAALGLVLSVHKHRFT